MVKHGEWEVCTHIPTQTVLPSQLLSDPQGQELPVTQPMVDLLCAILQRSNDLKNSWPTTSFACGKLIMSSLAHFRPP